jgi:DNA-binding response OmpR family regulator
MQKKILVVDDEESIRAGLVDNFELEGYTVASAADGDAALSAVEDFHPQIVLLDVMLPQKDGFEVCRILRNKYPDLYIIMLSAKDENTAQATGFGLGADDYITKPYDLLVLNARVKRTFTRMMAVSALPATEDIIEFRGIRLDFKKYECSKNGVPVDLAAREYQIMRYFYARRGEVVFRGDLLRSVWGYDEQESLPATRTVDNHIVSLRKKLEDNPGDPTLLVSVRGAGYKLDID